MFTAPSTLTEDNYKDHKDFGGKLHHFMVKLVLPIGRMSVKKRKLHNNCEALKVFRRNRPFRKVS